MIRRFDPPNASIHDPHQALTQPASLLMQSLSHGSKAANRAGIAVGNARVGASKTNVPRLLLLPVAVLSDSTWWRHPDAGRHRKAINPRLLLSR